MSVEKRLTELEIRLTHQETTIEELNQTIYEQWQTIEKLTKDVVLLRDRLKTMAPSSEIDDAPYVPPHY